MTELLGPPDASDVSPHPPRRRLPRWLGITIVAVVFLGLLGLSVAGVAQVRHIFVNTPAPDYAGPGTGRVQLTIPDGATASDIGSILFDAGVVKSARAFTKAASDDPQSRLIQAGVYALPTHTSAKNALHLLLDPASRVISGLLIVEGRTLNQIFAKITQVMGIPVASLRAAAANPAALGVPPWAGGLEGYLFPAKYQFPPKATAQQVLSAMVARFNAEAAQAQLVARAGGLGYSPQQVMTVASLIEHEAAAPTDRPKVARVIYNRLAKQMPLGLESTVRYALGDPTGPITQSQLDAAKSSPYDTYVHPGLPPGPIDSPGDAAIEAALTPTPGPWLYFVTLPKENQTLFATTDAEFQKIAAQCRAEGGNC